MRKAELAKMKKKAKKKLVSFRIPSDLWDRLIDIKKRTGYSASETIVSALQGYLK